MTEPKRWLEDGSAPEEVLSLLRSLPAPTPPSPAKQAALTRRLVDLSGAKATPPPAPRPMNWLKLGIAGTAIVVAGALLYLSRASEAPAPASQPPHPSPAAPSEPRAAFAAPSSNPGLPAPRETVKAPTLRSSSSSKAPLRDTLAEEELLLEQARRASASSPAEAWGLLEQHRRKFPSGQLSAERAFLSVDVLHRLGKHAAAEREAERLIARFPKSTYAARLRAKQGAK